jgi:hypothetical protein
MKVGDQVRSAPGTLAHFAGDRDGVIEQIGDEVYWVRMAQSGRRIPFRLDQLEANTSRT